MKTKHLTCLAVVAAAVLTLPDSLQSKPVCGFAACSQVTAIGCPGEGGCTRTTYYRCFGGMPFGGACGLNGSQNSYCYSVGSATGQTYTETTNCALTGDGNTCDWPALYTNWSDCSDMPAYNTGVDGNCI